MNHIYRLIWSHSKNTWIIVSELVSARGKRSSRKIGAVAETGSDRFCLGHRLACYLSPSLIMAFPLLFSPVAHALPEGGVVSAGQGAIGQNGSAMTVNQASQNLAINWQQFHIGQNESVTFNQPNASAIALNRVLGSDPSQILGQLSANGQVWVLNPNGVLFGQTAQVNVGGLVASTLNISDADFLAGRRTFNGNGGSVINQGTITAAPGGYVALLGGQVRNDGVITAQMGTVALGAGDRITLDFAGDKLLNLSVDGSTLNALVDNQQLIKADGGIVLLTAKATDALLNTVVNNDGIIEARTVENHAGTIKLLGGMDGGTVHAGGILDASAPMGGDGGFVETSGTRVTIAENAIVTTIAPFGHTGTWLIDPNDYTIAASGGDITGSQLSTSLDSNNIIIQSADGGTAGNGDIFVNDAVSWNANTLTLTAARDININAVMTASGTAALTMNTATTNGGNAGVAGGTVKVGFAPGQANGFAGRVDFPGRSGVGFLTINGVDYTVLNSLGAQGSLTGTDLQGMNGNLAGNYALGTNIDASSTSGWNGGAGFAPVGLGFEGNFDGLGHTVTNLVINRPATDNQGMFGFISFGAIRNVGLVEVTVSGRDYVGGLAGFGGSAFFVNNYTTGSISGNSYVGGLVGLYDTDVWNGQGNISGSYSTSTVTGAGGGQYVGGLAGGLQLSSVVINSYATGSVSGNDTVGGLVGFSHAGTISGSYATGNVSGNTGVGGLIGSNNGIIGGSYATGNVVGNTFVGGLMGWGGWGDVSNSYATGSASGSDAVGGLVGGNADFTFTNSYATGHVVGTTNVGGLIGYSSVCCGDSTIVTNSFWDTQTSGQAASAGGTGRTTAQMTQQANFTGWDFANTWRIYEGYTAPLLKSFLTPLTLTANASKTYDGQAYSGGAYTGSVSYNPANILGTANYGGAAQGKVNVGSYALTLDGGGLYSNQQGYDLISFVNGTLTINPKTLTVTATGQNKVYDGTTSATVTLGDNRIAGDLLDLIYGSASFTTPIIGNGKTVNVAGISLTGGASSGNYALGNITATTTANVTAAPAPDPAPAPPTVNNQTGNDRYTATLVTLQREEKTEKTSAENNFNRIPIAIVAERGVSLLMENGGVKLPEGLTPETTGELFERQR